MQPLSNSRQNRFAGKKRQLCTGTYRYHRGIWWTTDHLVKVLENLKASCQPHSSSSVPDNHSFLLFSWLTLVVLTNHLPSPKDRWYSREDPDRHHPISNQTAQSSLNNNIRPSVRAAPRRCVGNSDTGPGPQWRLLIPRPGRISSSQKIQNTIIINEDRG